MNPYEIMLLLDAELADDRQNEILTRIRELVAQRGGSWQSDDAWGRRKLAYEIDKKNEAHYHLFHFDCEPATLDELTRVLRTRAPSEIHPDPIRATTSRIASTTTSGRSSGIQ